MSPLSHLGPRRPLVIAMLVQYSAGGAIMPFLALFLRERGLAMSQVSLVVMSGSCALMVSPLFWGMLADRFVPVNHLLKVINLLAAAALVVFAFQHTFWGLAMAFTCFYACYQPAPFLVSSLCLRHVPDPFRHFASLRAWGSLGWLVPSLAVFLWMALGWGQDFSLLPWLSATAFVAMAIYARWLPHTPPGAAPHAGVGSQLSYGAATRRLLHNRNYLVLLVSYFFVAASFSILFFYSPPRMVDAGLPALWVGPVQIYSIVAEVILLQWQAHIGRRIGYHRMVIVGCLMLVARQAIYVWSDNLWLLTSSYALVGVTVVFYHIGVSVLAEDIAGPEVKATAQTLLVLCSSGLGPIAGNLAVSRLARGPSADLHRVFVWGMASAAVAAVLLLWRGARIAPRRVLHD